MKLNYIGEFVSGYVSQEFNSFIEWITPLKIVGHDVETNVVPSILDRVLITIQYSDKNTVWVLKWSYLSTEEQETVKRIMNESHRKFIIHSDTFEYTIWKKYDVILKNVWDTYSTEQILNTGKGAEEGSYSLEKVIFKRFGITLSKDAQLTFGDNMMTKEKVEYAAGDVVHALELMEIQLSELKAFDKSFPQPNRKGLVKTTWWENEFSLVAGDLEYEGMVLDPIKWTDCYNTSYPKMVEIKQKLDEIVIRDFKEFATQQEWLSDKDRFESIWGSSQKKKEILQLVFPDIEDTTKVGLKEYLKDNDPDFPEVVDTVNYKKIPESVVFPMRKIKVSGKEWENHDYPYKLEGKFAIIKMLILESKKQSFVDELNQIFYKNYPDFMKERDYVIPANTLSLNWASPAQKLVLFKYINPKIESTDAQTVEDNLLTHELFSVYQEYQEAAGLVTKFGLDYLNHIQADGRIRTVFNRVLATGRLSAKNPNLLQLPRNQAYRACFVAPETNLSGVSRQKWKIVDADYDAEELVFIAVLSKEPKWIEALENGWDLHSINAELLYEEKWHQGTEEGCKFLLNKQKCNCKIHKELRTTSKTLSFGLSYGLSSYGFAARNHISEEEAVRLINKFFNNFQNIHSFLSKCGMFGVRNNFIYEYGTGRVRFFDAWKTAKRENYYGDWVYVNEGEMRGVMRASSNFPIQSLGASVLKIACVLLRRWILNNNYQNDISIALPVHDQLLLYAKEEVSEVAAKNLEHYMLLAGRLVLKNDLLRAKAKISDYWIKD